MRTQKRDWNEIGKLDGLWSILSEPDKRHRRWDVDEFFATGRREVDVVIATAEQWDLPVRHRLALDFGCGVGRLSRALAAHFEQVVGVDISDVMISQARELNLDVPKCSFQVLDGRTLGGFADRSFDLIYSWIVLQHIANRQAIEGRIYDFMRLLADGGILVFQLPSSIPMRRRIQLRPRLYAALRRLHISQEFLYGQLGLHPIRMCAIPEDAVVRMLVSAGGRVLRIDRSRMGQTAIQDRTYYVTTSGPGTSSDGDEKSRAR